jgi:hypothetical protein
MQTPDAEYELKNKHFKSEPFFCNRTIEGIRIRAPWKDHCRLQYCQIGKEGHRLVKKQDIIERQGGTTQAKGTHDC